MEHEIISNQQKKDMTIKMKCIHLNCFDNTIAFFNAICLMKKCMFSNLKKNTWVTCTKVL